LTRSWEKEFNLSIPRIYFVVAERNGWEGSDGEGSG